MAIIHLKNLMLKLKKVAKNEKSQRVLPLTEMKKTENKNDK